MFIRSERLFLRPIWPEDWQDVFRGIDEPQVVRNLSRAPWPYTPQDARDFAGMPQDGRCPHFLITRPKGSDGVDIIGVIGLAQMGDEVELGYWIARAHWGQGYATEAGRALLSLVPTLGHRRIVARHFCDNPGSARVLAKLGFRPVGDVSDAYCVARRSMVPTQMHELVLAAADNCDEPEGGGLGGHPGGDRDGTTPGRRAA